MPATPTIALREPCLTVRCYSPIACGGYGYCRERNSHRPPSNEQLLANRDAAAWAAALAWVASDNAPPVRP